ncbi:MAG: NAD(+) diphosphatase [Catonella sp.]|uniref:NAD(+) diphosphatase n=1 Tax=Catonella sp. TaxID=2382125 RepID=UPI003FA02021
MIQDLLNNDYNNSYNPNAKANDESLILYFKNNDLLCHAEGNIESLENAIPGKANSEEIIWTLPTFSELNDKNTSISDKLIYLFKMKLDGVEKELYLLNDDNFSPETKNLCYLPALKYRSIKPLDTSFAVITAWQLYSWYKANRYCGRCGHHTTLDSKERMVRCPKCNNLIYPKICPGVIVGIISKGRILLTKYANKGYNRYALVAGFTEIGETLEESAAREAFEEVGLKLKNISFYKSQPWSASSSLLAGFFAEVDGDDKIQLDKDELKEGTWFYPEDIIQMHEGVSLTEEMINYFADKKLDAKWYVS